MCTTGRNSGKWATIPVPSCWEMQGFGTYNYYQDGENGGEQGFYKHEFNIVPQHQGKRVFIVFEGAMTDTEVKINGQPAGPTHQGGFYEFKYDIPGRQHWFYARHSGHWHQISTGRSNGPAKPKKRAQGKCSGVWGALFRFPVTSNKLFQNPMPSFYALTRQKARQNQE